MQALRHCLKLLFFIMPCIHWLQVLLNIAILTLANVSLAQLLLTVQATKGKNIIFLCQYHVLFLVTSCRKVATQSEDACLEQEVAKGDIELSSHNVCDSALSLSQKWRVVVLKCRRWEGAERGKDWQTCWRIAHYTVTITCNSVLEMI